MVRHGETEWSRDGRHTSVTDLPLTETGEEAATALAPRLEAAGMARLAGPVRAVARSEHQALLDDAKALAEAGAFAIVLELVTPPVAKEISQAISIPTIGIGSGPDCGGQILVTQDLIGAFPWFTPRFVKPTANCANV